MPVPVHLDKVVEGLAENPALPPELSAELLPGERPYPLDDTMPAYLRG